MNIGHALGFSISEPTSYFIGVYFQNKQKSLRTEWLEIK